MIEITIRPHAHTIDLLRDYGDAESDYWLGRKLPASAARRLARYQELGTARLLDAIHGAVVVWSSDQVHVSGGVEEVTLTPEKKAVRRRVAQILDHTFLDVLRADPVGRAGSHHLTP